MIAAIKIWLWKLSLLPDKVCPVCGGELIARGYDDYGYPGGRYECLDKNCKFNK